MATFWSTTDKTASVTLSGSNLIATSSSSAQGGRAADIKATGKWYFEVTCNTFVNGNTGIGVANAAASLSGMGGSSTNVCLIYPSGNIWLNGGVVGALGSIPVGSVVGIAFDLTNNTIWFRLGAAGNWNNNASYNPATNTGGISLTSIISTGLYPAYALGASGEQVTANFGDTAFTGTAPAGFTSGVRNFTTWSTTDKSSITLTNGNLTAAASSNGFQAVRTVDRQINGKWYFEYTFAVSGASTVAGGFASAAVGLNSLGTIPGTTANAAIVSGGGQISSNNANTGFLAGFGAGGVVCFALDLDQKLFWVRNGAAGNWNGSASANPVTAAGGFAFDFVGGGIPAYGVMSANSAIGTALTANFGGSAFTGAVPSGFTSGFPAGASISTNEIVTQAGVEEWGSSNPSMQATQVGVEEWGTPVNPGIVTQVSAEHWATTSPAAAVTQALVEHWGTVDTISTQAVVTQVAVEHWITEAAVSTARLRRVVCVSG